MLHSLKTFAHKRRCVDIGGQTSNEPRCKDRIFPEDLAMKAAAQLEAQRLEAEYIKHPIKIGHSWGITFPKDITEVFGLNKSKTLLRMHPDVKKGKIEISLQ